MDVFLSSSPIIQSRDHQHKPSGTIMSSAILLSLQRLGQLTEDDLKTVERAMWQRVRRIDAGQTIVQKTDVMAHVYIVLEGWVYRYKYLPNGRRQIIAYLVPGDVTDLGLYVRPRVDHAIAAATSVSVAEIPLSVIEQFFGGAYPRIGRALWLKSMMATAIQREWTVNLGQRSAPERIGHILCELFHRLRAVGLTEGNQCHMPLTQSDLAEATGLSLVHVNKRLQDLRGAGLISLRGKTLTIPNLVQLEKASLFSPDYLLLEDLSAEAAA